MSKKSKEKSVAEKNLVNSIKCCTKFKKSEYFVIKKLHVIWKKAIPVEGKV